MNKKRRRRVLELIERLQVAREILRDIYDEEKDALDNMPESFEDTDRYQQIEEASDHLDNAYDSLIEAIQSLQEI